MNNVYEQELYCYSDNHIKLGNRHYPYRMGVFIRRGQRQKCNNDVNGREKRGVVSDGHYLFPYSIICSLEDIRTSQMCDHRCRDGNDTFCEKVLQSYPLVVSVKQCADWECLV